MKQLSFSLGILSLLLIQSTCALASEASDTLESGIETHREGTKEVLTSPMHMVDDTASGINSKKPVAGTAEGVITGTEKTGVQTLKGTEHMIEGTSKILTAPIEAVTE